MTEFARFLVLLTVCGLTVTVLGSGALWFADEERRLRRALRHVVGGAMDGVIVAKGRGRGAGLSLGRSRIAVAWDRGAWCLVYRLDELSGAELIIDGQVMARVHRGETRRALDFVPTHADQVSLRLVFVDPLRPHFDLDLWLAGDEARRDAPSPAAAVKEANQWLARIEAIQQRMTPPAKTAAPEVRMSSPKPAPAPVAEDSAPPWDDEADL